MALELFSLTNHYSDFISFSSQFFVKLVLIVSYKSINQFLTYLNLKIIFIVNLRLFLLSFQHQMGLNHSNVCIIKQLQLKFVFIVILRFLMDHKWLKLEVNDELIMNHR